MNKFNLLSEVEDDYSTDEMVPEQVDEAAEEPVAEPESAADDVVENENVSEVTAMKARMALLEAIVDQAVEDEVEESAKEGTDEAEVKDDDDKDEGESGDESGDDEGSEDEETVDTEKATAIATELVDKAIALHYVPSSFRKRIPAIVARHLKVNDPKMALYSKAATFFTAAMTDEVITADGEPDTIAEAVDASAADLGDPIEKTQEFEGDNKQEGGETETNADDAPDAPKARYRSRRERKLKASLESFLNPMMEGMTADDEKDTVDEVLDTGAVQAEDISVTEEFDGDNKQEGGETETNADDAPDAPKASVVMRRLAASIINKKTATRDVSVAVTGRMLDKMLHDLRFQLPAKFVRKYKVR